MEVYKTYLDDAELSLVHLGRNETKWIMTYEDEHGNEVKFDVSPELLQQIVEVTKASQ